MKYRVVIFIMMLIICITSNTVHATSKGIWLSTQEITTKSTISTSWDQIVKYAKGSWGTPKIADQDNNHDVFTLAGAIYYIRTGDIAMRDKVATNIFAAQYTEKGGRTLALGRNLISYILAADLIDLASYNPSRELSWRTWLASTRHEVLDGMTLIQTHERRPNNWGTHAGATRIVIDLYIGDINDLDRAITVFRGWLGDRTFYTGFTWGDLSWQCNPKEPVGINPSCSKNGHDIGGALPDDMRRGAKFTWPPKYTNYPWGALGPALVTGQMLHRAGYDSYNWSNQALYRAMAFMDKLDKTFPKTGWYAKGDDEWIPHLVNYMYLSEFKEKFPARYGKSMGWTDYTH